MNKQNTGLPSLTHTHTATSPHQNTNKKCFPSIFLMSQWPKRYHELARHYATVRSLQNTPQKDDLHVRKSNFASCAPLQFTLKQNAQTTRRNCQPQYTHEMGFHPSERNRSKANVESAQIGNFAVVVVVVVVHANRTT